MCLEFDEGVVDLTSVRVDMKGSYKSVECKKEMVGN